jgi:hypothetical protein
MLLKVLCSSTQRLAHTALGVFFFAQSIELLCIFTHPYTLSQSENDRPLLTERRTAIPLLLEVYNPHLKTWVEAGRVSPGDPPGSMSNNTLDGSRELYIFECAVDDSTSTIYVVPGKGDVATTHVRAVLNNRQEWLVFKKLRKNQVLELTVKTDRSPQSRKLRFRQT